MFPVECSDIYNKISEITQSLMHENRWSGNKTEFTTWWNGKVLFLKRKIIGPTNVMGKTKASRFTTHLDFESHSWTNWELPAFNKGQHGASKAKTHKVLYVSIYVLLHSWCSGGHPATNWTELQRVRLMAGAVTLLRQLQISCDLLLVCDEVHLPLVCDEVHLPLVCDEVHLPLVCDEVHLSLVCDQVHLPLSLLYTQHNNYIPDWDTVFLTSPLSLFPASEGHPHSIIQNLQ